MEVLVVLALIASLAALVVGVLVLRRLAADDAGQQGAELQRALGSADAQLRELGRRQTADAASLNASLQHAVQAMGQMDVRMDALRADVTSQLAQSAQSMSQGTDALRAEVSQQLALNARAMDERLAQDHGLVDGKLDLVSASMNDRLGQMSASMNQSIGQVGTSVTQQVGALNSQVNDQMAQIREDTNRQLEAVRATVDEKLTKTLNDRLSLSFNQINEQLEAVHQGLGAMQSLASNVGDLRRVLSNVKTRGMLGEVQLGAILREVLAPGQYEENVAIKPRSKERVEFAVKIPTDSGETILLPIDAKFPGDAYQAVLDAQEAADAAGLQAARRTLEGRIKQEARDISSKYISVPRSTNFAIMFLPIEGLYAEVVSMPGLIEELQRRYAVNVAGPSTMAALLNSLQLSYQTIALQKQTDEVLKVLQAVKAELPKYQAALVKAKKQIDTASGTVDHLINTRTNQMERRLRTIALPEGMEPEPTEVEAVLEEPSESA